MKAVFKMRIAIAIYETTWQQQTAGKELDQDCANKVFIYL